MNEYLILIYLSIRYESGYAAYKEVVVFIIFLSFKKTLYIFLGYQLLLFIIYIMG